MLAHRPETLRRVGRTPRLQSHVRLEDHMTALHPTPSATPSPDVARLTADFRTTVLPAAKDFLNREISATALRERWRPYYYEIFHLFDLNVEQAWRGATETNGGLESGAPP